MTGLYPFLLAGGLGGLASALAYSVLWSAVDLWRPQVAALWSGGRSLGITGVLLHFVGGTVLGMLFWLSWGLAALIDVSWWERGLVFGGLVWTALSVPSILTTSFARDLPWQSALSLLLQWACTCLLAGCACAWSWESALTA
ncbi:MAG: hypothetical protein ABW034_22655 [Steroidobacteraceae bacterium]